VLARKICGTAFLFLVRFLENTDMSYLFTVIGFILGSVLGSFVKALADRSLTRKSFWGRSYCLMCKKKLQWYDLIPIFSYLFLKGKCRYCKKNIGTEYLVVEVVLGFLIAFLFWQTFLGFQFSLTELSVSYEERFRFSIFLWNLFYKTFFIVVLAILFLTDIKKMLIPDRIIIPSIIIGITCLVIVTIYKVSYLYYLLSQSSFGRKLLPPHSDYFQRHAFLSVEPLIYGIAAGFLIGLFFTGLIIITRGKGMGGGDVKLGAFMGIILGFPQALLALMLAFFTGAIFSLFLIILGKKSFGQSIPFGPFLVLGSLTALFWGDQILDWYLHLGR